MPQLKYFLPAVLVATAIACGKSPDIPTPTDETGSAETFSDMHVGDTPAHPDAITDGAVETVASDVTLTDTSLDAGSCSGAPRCPCSTNAECDNQLCLATADGHFCAATCNDSAGCLASEDCGQLSGSGGDVLQVCVARWVSSCSPCLQNGDCNFPGAPSGIVCAPLGNSGSFCTSKCTVTSDCAPGFSCTNGICHPPGGACACSAWSVDHTRTTKCLSPNEAGTCTAQLTCNTVGPWPACLAATPTPETCNGKDDDCNGLTDDGANASCDDKNDCTQDACSGGKCQNLKNVVCGDGLCTTGCGENIVSCPIDCPKCPDGVCTPGESPASCPTDCCGHCGDGKCIGYECGESPTTCAQDCGNACGNLVCDKGENPGSCPTDCKKQACGNGVCESTDGGPIGCPKDCAATCGNCVCEGTEDFTSCPNDCGYCGDGTCSMCNALGENPACVADCGDIATIGCATMWAKFCQDGTPCTTDTCVQGQGCVHLASSATCSDGSACTTDDSCVGGMCSPGPALICDDGNPCTNDICDKAVGCTYFSAEGKPCTDNNACTVGDMCVKSKCEGGLQTDCNDSNPCTDDACPVSGNCTHLANDAPCTDNTACTSGEHCAGGVCVVGKVLQCADGNPCTIDSCNMATGCTYAYAAGAGCDDGMACTIGDICVNGACTGGAQKDCNDGNSCTDDDCVQSGKCQYLPNDTTCTDANACTAGEHCSDGACKGAMTVNCDDGKQCTVDSCSVQNGCSHLITDGAGCNDGDACTVGDACQADVCMSGKAPDCNDGNPCTDDGCPVAGGCEHLANSATCTDNTACTVGEHCAKSVCGGATTLNCDDGQICTNDVCDPIAGCEHQNADTSTCSDDNLCTVGDACSGGVCVSGGLQDCDDSNPCTDDTCIGTGGCTHLANSATCTDSNPCTVGEACADKACKGGTAALCSDGNGCTKDNCDPASGCVFPALDGGLCNDLDACTIGDVCVGDACTPGMAKNCGDGNACTDDTCAAGVCLNAANTATCDDKNPCTLADACAATVCAGTWNTCDDSNPCTADSCSGNGACVNLPLSATPCNDGTVCTTQDACTNGSCGGTAVNCADAFACTTDTCDPVKGCAHVVVDSACNDGVACTTDACSLTTGCSHVAVNATCNDSTSCTTDTCNLSTGCVHADNGTTCNDGNLCTTDVCTSGASATGCTHPNNTLNCNDNNLCTITDKCAGGSCKGTGTPTCDDGNGCTTDTCPSAAGCVNTANSASCNDGNTCTQTDYCSAKSCIGTNPQNCDDGDVCTDDHCTNGVGCQHSNNSAPCDDGVGCTYNDHCTNDACAGTPGGCDPYPGKPWCTQTCDPTFDCQLDDTGCP